MKPDTPTIQIDGVPDSITSAATWRSRFATLASSLLRDNHLDHLLITVGTAEAVNTTRQALEKFKNIVDGKKNLDDEQSVDERALRYKSQPSRYAFDFLVVPDSTKDELLVAASLIELEQKVFHQWGLTKIEPFPRVALNFYGPSGTGKTLAASALAHYLKVPIMVISYAQIESKFHGDGPKNVEAVFHAAERDKALLFIDEADSLLSARLTEVRQGSEQAINSMRSQLLINLEQFSGVVVFSTNLVSNYDNAFLTRIKNIHFPLPDFKSRREIWYQHLNIPTLPLQGEINYDDLAKIEDISGRDIKNAVVDAALRAAAIRDYLTQEDLLRAIERIKQTQMQVSTHRVPSLRPVSTENEALQNQIQSATNAYLVAQENSLNDIPHL